MSVDGVSAAGSASTQASHAAGQVKSRYGVKVDGYTAKEVKALDEGFDKMLMEPIIASMKKLTDNLKKMKQENS